VGACGSQEKSRSRGELNANATMQGTKIALIVVSCLLMLTAALFSVYVALDRQHMKLMQETFRDAPLVTEALPHLMIAFEKQVAADVEEGEGEPDMAGLIIETRDHHNLRGVMDNFRAKFPDVPIYIFHGLTNKDWLQERYGDDPAGVHMIPLESDNLTIQQYNYLMTRPELWDHIHARHVLVFQTDSVLFTNSQVQIEQYFKYDYVGAPWHTLYHYYVRNAFMFRALDKHTWAGNGGLSLRRRSTMVAITTDVPYLSIPYAAEDVYFSNAMDQVDGVVLPTREVAARLFFERIETDELPLGAHKYLPKTHTDLIEDNERLIINKY